MTSFVLIPLILNTELTARNFDLTERRFDLLNNIKGMPLVNIVAAEIITEEDNPRIMCFDTASSVTPEPFVSEGDEKELRVKNTILAQNCLEDIIKGYDIKLKDVVFRPELFAVLDGGSEEQSHSGAVSRYAAPIAGVTSNRTRFTLRLYSEEKNGNGEPEAYCRFSFPHCVGTPASFTLEDGSFFTPEYEIHSRPSRGENAMLIECMSNMPVYVEKVSDVPSSPKLGDEIIITQSMSLGGIGTVNAGDSLYWNGSSFVRE